jgi:hypothetical protein
MANMDNEIDQANSCRRLLANHLSKVDIAKISPKSAAMAAEATSTMASKLDLPVEARLPLSRNPYRDADRMSGRATIAFDIARKRRSFAPPEPTERPAIGVEVIWEPRLLRGK